MNDPTVTIGGRQFAIPEFTVKQQRKVTPALMKMSTILGDLANEEAFGQMLDTLFLCITIGREDAISRDEFEGLPIRPFEMANSVFPVLLQQAGLIKAAGGTGGAGDAAPDTPLSGETTLTTSSQTSS